jgi:hypothetical protein
MSIPNLRLGSSLLSLLIVPSLLFFISVPRVLFRWHAGVLTGPHGCKRSLCLKRSSAMRSIAGLILLEIEVHAPCRKGELIGEKE